MFRTISIALAATLSFTFACVARADEFRLPKSGTPAFVVDNPPAGWQPAYDKYGNLQFMAADRSAAFQVSMIDDAKVETTPLTAIAENVFTAAKLGPYTHTEPGSVLGLSGQSFSRSSTLNNVPIDIKVIISKLDASHAAVVSTISRRAITSAQSASLADLIAHTKLDKQ